MTTDAYRAVRESCALADRSAWGRVAVTGPDRRSWLQGLLTNDIEALTPGTGCYAAILTPQGRMVSDLRVLELGDRILLDTPPPVRDSLVSRLEPLIIMEDVQIEDCSDRLGRRALHGPAAASVLAAGLDAGVTEADFAGMAEHANRRVQAPGGEVVVASTRELGVPGFDCYASSEVLAALDAALAGQQVPRLDEATWQVLRIEAGTPEFGPDMDEETIPLEAGLEARAISHTKGCYVGQEVIIRVLHRGGGRVAKRLVGIRCDTAGPPGGAAVERGAELRAGDRLVGHVTSAAYSPRCGASIALGYVHRDFVEPGTALQVVVRGAAVAATVSALPFVRAATQ